MAAGSLKKNRRGLTSLNQFKEFSISVVGSEFPAITVIQDQWLNSGWNFKKKSQLSEKNPESIVHTISFKWTLMKIGLSIHTLSFKWTWMKIVFYILQNVSFKWSSMKIHYFFDLSWFDLIFLNQINTRRISLMWSNFNTFQCTVIGAAEQYPSVNGIKLTQIEQFPNVSQ